MAMPRGVGVGGRVGVGGCVRVEGDVVRGGWRVIVLCLCVQKSVT